MTLLKSNFPTKEILPDEEKVDPTEEFLKKAKESIGGSMVFVERTKLHYDPLREDNNADQ